MTHEDAVTRLADLLYPTPGTLVLLGDGGMRFVRDVSRETGHVSLLDLDGRTTTITVEDYADLLAE